MVTPAKEKEMKIAIPSSIIHDEKEASKQRKKRRRLIFLAKKVKATAPGGTFMTGCNIADVD